MLNPGIADDGGVALTLSNGTTIIDKAGMSANTAENTPLDMLSGNLNQSYERRPGGSYGSWADTDNNKADFVLIAPSGPQSLASSAVPPSDPPTSTPSDTATLTLTPTDTGTPTETFTPMDTATPTGTPTKTGTATSTGTMTPTRTRTPTRTPSVTRTITLTRTPSATATFVPGDVVINEFLPHPRSDWNADGMANVNDEYIELINVSASSINIKNWKLDNGIGGASKPFSLPDVTLLPYQIIRFFRSESGIALSDGGSTVRLLRSDGRTADILNYPVVVAADETWCRLPDGTGVWAFTCRPTPGRLNTPLGSGTPGTGPGGETGNGMVEPVCSLDAAIPAFIREAECSHETGAGIVEFIGEGEYWLQSRWKWNIFMQ
jgi:hypothetical protein